MTISSRGFAADASVGGPKVGEAAGGANADGSGAARPADDSSSPLLAPGEVRCWECCAHQAEACVDPVVSVIHVLSFDHDSV